MNRIIHTNIMNRGMGSANCLANNLQRLEKVHDGHARSPDILLEDELFRRVTDPPAAPDEQHANLTHSAVSLADDTAISPLPTFLSLLLLSSLSPLSIFLRLCLLFFCLLPSLCVFPPCPHSSHSALSLSPPPLQQSSHSLCVCLSPASNPLAVPSLQTSLSCKDSSLFLTRQRLSLSLYLSI